MNHRKTLARACLALLAAVASAPAASYKPQKASPASAKSARPPAGVPAEAAVPAPKAPAAKGERFYFPREAQLGYVLADPAAPDGEWLASQADGGFVAI